MNQVFYFLQPENREESCNEESDDKIGSGETSGLSSESTTLMIVLNI